MASSRETLNPYTAVGYFSRNKMVHKKAGK